MRPPGRVGAAGVPRSTGPNTRPTNTIAATVTPVASSVAPIRRFAACERGCVRTERSPRDPARRNARHRSRGGTPDLRGGPRESIVMAHPPRIAVAGQGLGGRCGGGASRSPRSRPRSQRPGRGTGPRGSKAPRPAPVAEGARGIAAQNSGSPAPRSGSDSSCSKRMRASAFASAARRRKAETERFATTRRTHASGRFVGTDPVPVTVCSEERLLCQVLGTRAGAGQRVRQTHHGQILPPIEILEWLRAPT
jgi:hypothetical protein